MKVKLYAVLDKTSGIYDGPVGNHNDGSAMRAFGNMCQGEGPIARNPECYSLWRVGEWNDATGEVTSEVKECLGYGS